MSVQGSRSKVVASILAAIAIIAGLILASKATPATGATVTYYPVQCALRNPGSGWAIINDAAHEPRGCQSVTASVDRLILVHSVGATQVNTMVATTDETFAQQELFIGASAGLNLSYIFIYKGGVLVNPMTLATPTGNVWVNGGLQK